MIITADHGNAECIWDEQGNPWTAHTTNPVPFILVKGEGLKIPEFLTNIALRSDGCLADIAPTILEILGLPQPPQMTRQSLLKSPGSGVRRHSLGQLVGFSGSGISSFSNVL
jgi:2,3-bisphosphoglycerate-independent phosphoglycerate mutase